MKAALRKTAKGLELLEFEDLYGKNCQLRQSSLAKYLPPGTSAVWLGLESSPISNSRLHLSAGQVRWLVRQLNHWLETGRFDPEQLEYEDWPEVEKKG